MVFPYRYVKWSLLWFCVTCLLFGVASDAIGQTGRITGTVRVSETGAPIAGATIEATDGSERMVTTSRSDGTYTIENVPFGTYTVVVSFIGYRRESVSEVAVSGTPATVDVDLIIAPYELDVMVVSASRQTESIVDAPVSISKVDAVDIQKQATGNSYASLMRTTTGIHYTQRGILSEAFNARGFNEAFNSRMLVFLDGRRIRATSEQAISMPLPKDDLQYMEVINGPGSALYGPDAASGVISVTSKDPRTSQGTVLSLSGGSRETVKSRFRHAGFRSKWGWKVAGDFQRARDFERVDTFSSPNGAVSVTDDPDFNADTISGSAGVYYYPSGTSTVSLTAGASRVNLIDWFDTGRIQLDNLTQHFQHLVYRDNRFFFSVHHTKLDNGDTFALHTRALSQLAGLSPAAAQQQARIRQNRRFTGAEGRYAVSIPQLNDTRFTVGFDYFQERTNSNILLNGKVVLDQIGLFGQVETDLHPMVKAVAASRIDFHDIYETQVSPKAGLIIKPRPGMAFRATFNRAFRSPTSVNQRLLFTVQPGVVARGNHRGFQFVNAFGGSLPAAFAAGIPELKPEQNTTFELGFKTVLENRLFLDVSGYRSAYKDFISALTPIGDPLSGILVLDDTGAPLNEQTLTYLNFGKQSVLGADIGANLYATDRLMFRGNASFIDAGTLTATTGLTQPFNTPERMFNIGLSASDVGMSGTSLDLALRHVSEFDYAAGTVTGTIPAYTIVDANVGYRSNYGITYKLSVTNLLDNDHIETIGGASIGMIIVGEVQYAFR